MLFFGLGGLFYADHTTPQSPSCSSTQSQSCPKTGSSQEVNPRSPPPSNSSPFARARAQVRPAKRAPQTSAANEHTHLGEYRLANTAAPCAVGWGSTQTEPAFGGQADNTSVKAKIINLIASVRTLMRIPLIAINTLIIVYELILG
ncbi:hypothetical protein MBLNU459_g2192t2 [Dothideomycetes sp. NU459]